MAWHRRIDERPGRRDPFAVLGLGRGASPSQVDEARRRLAKSAHPDVGGSLAAMQQINAAADEALVLALATSAPPTAASPTTGRPDSNGRGGAAHDHPSFTIEALPAEAHAALLVVASWLGEVVDDEPPYALEALLDEPLRGWCRLSLVPDAGASTVSIVVAGDDDGRPAPDVVAVRDVWIDGLNRLDWNDLDGSCRPGGSA